MLCFASVLLWSEIWGHPGYSPLVFWITDFILPLAWSKNEWWLWTFRFLFLFMQCTFPPILVKKFERKKSPGTNGLRMRLLLHYKFYNHTKLIVAASEEILASWNSIISHADIHVLWSLHGADWILINKLPSFGCESYHAALKVCTSKGMMFSPWKSIIINLILLSLWNIASVLVGRRK